jgi:uncharacterized protein
VAGPVVTEDDRGEEAGPRHGSRRDAEGGDGRGVGTAVERTPDGRYVVIKGRRWRAEDPHLPAGVADRLRHELAAARRAVGAALKAADEDAERAARARVQRAKVGLGERGTPWWEQTEDERRARWELALTEDKTPGRDRASDPGPGVR